MMAAPESNQIQDKESQNQKLQTSRCEPIDIALKSLFLGPQSENAFWFSGRVMRLLEHYFTWRKRLFPNDGEAISPANMSEPKFSELRARMLTALDELLVETERETPKFTPRYIGHMVSEVSLPALLAEFALLLHNPNNASPEVARTGGKLEHEGIRALAEMIGFDPNIARGHFTSGGTVANFEAVWRARYLLDRRMSLALALIRRGSASPDDFFDLCHHDPQTLASVIAENQISESELRELSVLSQGPWGVDCNSLLDKRFQGPVLLVPGNKHYSWPKACAIFGLGEQALLAVALDEYGRLDLSDLERKVSIARQTGRPIVGVVSVAGTTELGEFDPIDRVQDRLDRYRREEGLHLWHHVDAAYGGYFACLKSLERPELLSANVTRSLRALRRVDSITIDPHKLGYIPYACGAFLTRDRAHYQTYSVTAPYLKAHEDSSNWATTLEGSRSAAGAAAVWLTSKTLPLDDSGFGLILEKSLAARREFQKILGEKIPEFKLITPVDSNVLCFSLCKPNDSLSKANARVQAIFEAIEAGPDFSVSRTSLTRSSYDAMIKRLTAEWDISDDGTSDLRVIRLVLMNPFIVSKEMRIDYAAEFARLVQSLLERVID